MLAKIVFLSLVVAVVSAEQKVPVSVYYEALCRDTITFFTKQLVPAYNSQLKNYMDLQLVPYGKASRKKSSDGNRWEFKCQHGPVECYGNKVQGCVLKQVRNEDDRIRYIYCLLRQAKTVKNEYPLGGCISGGDLDLVTVCANGTHVQPNGTQVQPNGDDVLAENGKVTARLHPPLASVPTVVFYHVFSKIEQDMAQTNFKEVLCSYLEDEPPSECGSESVASVSALALSLAVFRLL